MAEVVSLPKKTMFELFAAEQCALIIRRARKMAGLTRKQLADKCNIDRRRIELIEKGETDIGLNLLVAIGVACGFRLKLELEHAEHDASQGYVYLMPHRDSIPKI